MMLAISSQRWSMAIVACALPLVASCSEVKPAALSPAQSANQFRARSLDDEGLRKFAAQPVAGMTSWPPQRWDARALDLAALHFNPTLDVARSRWSAARADVVTAGQIPNPTVSISPQYVFTPLPDVPVWVLAASLIQIIEVAGKRQFRTARAAYLAEAARLEVVNGAWQIIFGVEDALLDVDAGRRRIAALDVQIEAQKALADIAGRLVTSGLGSSIEASTARTVLDRAVLEREAAKAGLTSAQQRLAQAIGIPASSLALDQIANVGAPGPLSTDVIRQAREVTPLNRADLLASLATYAASDAALQLELAGRYPDIQIGPAYDYDEGEHRWGVALAFTLPIFHQNQGPIAKAAAQRQQAGEEFVALQARVIGDVDRTVAAYEAARRSLATANELVRRQTEQLKAQQALFDRGETGRPALLAARAELAVGRLAQVDAETTLAKAQLALETASQRSLLGLDVAALVLQERK